MYVFEQNIIEKYKCVLSWIMCFTLSLFISNPIWYDVDRFSIAEALGYFNEYLYDLVKIIA